MDDQRPITSAADADGEETPAQATSDASDQQQAPKSHLVIIFRDMRDEELHLKIKPNTKLGKAMSLFCKRTERTNARFFFEGERIKSYMTPNDLGLDDGDIIEVHEEQIGGA